MRLLLLKFILQFLGTKTSHACGAHVLRRSRRAVRLQCERARTRLLLRHFDDESRHVGDQGALHNCSSNVRQWRLDEKPRLSSLCVCAKCPYLQCCLNLFLCIGDDAHDALCRLPLNPLLEIKALAASHDGACVAAVIPIPIGASAYFETN